MRKLKLQMQVSVDGFASTGPNDEQQWVTWAWDEIREQVLALSDASDTILIGRKLAMDYIPYWEGVTKRPDDPMWEVGERIVNARKIIFTRTLDEVPWKNTELAKGNLVEEVRKLKSEKGKDLMVYGGTSFVAALISEGLIDEFHLFINPVALGQGVPVFNVLGKWQHLKLLRTVTYHSGIVLLTYGLQ